MYCEWPQLRRFCFCMPLRRGVLTFGYIHILYTAFMIVTYSYAVHHALGVQWLVYIRPLYLPAEICLAFFCGELIFDGLLIYGAHKKALAYLKAYYCYTMMTYVAVTLIQLLDLVDLETKFIATFIDSCIISFLGLCLQLYLLILVRSLIKKLQRSGPHVFDNQLHQIVNGEVKEPNGIYNNPTVVPTEV